MSAVTAAAAAKQRALDEEAALKKAANKAVEAPKTEPDPDELRDGEGLRVVKAKPASRPQTGTSKPVRAK